MLEALQEGPRPLSLRRFSNFMSGSLKTFHVSQLCRTGGDTNRSNAFKSDVAPD